MFKVILLSFLTIAVLNSNAVSSTRIKIVNNGYRDILIALPSNVDAKTRPKLVSTLKGMLQHSSALLLSATKGRATFSNATFLVPGTWGDIDSWLPGRDNTTTFDDAGALLSRDQADIVVTSSGVREYPYTLHHQGCRKHSLRIYIPSNHLLSGNLQIISMDFLRLWSEFRYGIFPEGGFENDNKYPLKFQVPGETAERTTECVNKPFRIPTECEVDWECDESLIKPSIMDHHYRNGTAFCEGHTGLGQIHIADTPSKQNLLCNEEGTYLTMLKTPDFKNGKNSAPKEQTQSDVSFQFLKEATANRVFVVIEVSSRMRQENRYTVTHNAFSRFVINDIPDGSELNVLLFGGEQNNTLITSDLIINGETSRSDYLESQPLPEEPSDLPHTCPECALDDVMEIIENATSPSPLVILVTTQLYIDGLMYIRLKNVLQLHEIRLQVMLLGHTHTSNINQQSSLYSLCLETGNQFTFLGKDSLGNLYSGFARAVQSTSGNVLITQRYLSTNDEEELIFPITVDASKSQALTVSLSGPLFRELPLEYGNTVLKGPETSTWQPRKKELIPAWIFHVLNPKTGTYTVKTLRKLGATSPILVTVTGSPLKMEDSITIKLWVESIETKLSQPPIQIFAEVRKGLYPIMNATVTAYVHHPDNDGVSEITLLDDGLGSVDITKGDGVYTHIFTNFTSSGFYNVYLNVTGGIEDSAIVQKASTYELKLFRERSLIRNRFFDSGLEIYNETILTTDVATYGTTLFHVITFSQPPESGLYYAGIRAVDEAGNCGEPSNAVAILLESNKTYRHIDCRNLPSPERHTSMSITLVPSTVLLIFTTYIFNYFLRSVQAPVLAL